MPHSRVNSLRHGSSWVTALNLLAILCASLVARQCGRISMGEKCKTTRVLRFRCRLRSHRWSKSITAPHHGVRIKHILLLVRKIPEIIIIIHFIRRPETAPDMFEAWRMNLDGGADLHNITDTTMSVA